MTDPRLPLLAAHLERKVLWLSTWTIHNANHLRDHRRRAEGRRPPGLLRLARDDHDGALLRGAAAGGPGRGEAACQPGLPRHPVPVRQPDPREARELPRLRRRAVLSVAHQGHRRRRFLDRLGRARRRADAVRRRSCRTTSARRAGAASGPRAGWSRWSATPRWTRATSSRPCSRAGSTACATPGGSSTTTARASTPWCARACGRSSRRCSATSAGTSSSSSTARCSRRPSPSPAASACAPGSTPARTSSTRRSTFQGGAAWRKRLLDELGDQGDVTALIERRSDDELAALMGNLGGHDLPIAARGLRGGARARPAGLLHRLHDQGLRPAARRPQGQPCRPDDADPDGGASATAMSVRPGHEWDPFEGLDVARGELRALPRRRAVRRRRAAAATRRRAIPVPERLPAPSQPTLSTQAGLRPDPARDRARDDRLRRPHRHDLARRHRLDQSRRLGEPARPVRPRGDGRHRSRKERIPSTFNWDFSPAGPAHRARHRRDRTCSSLLVGARPVAFALRRAAAAGRHALRSLHRARPRCAELRLLPGCPLHPGGDAVGRDAGAGGRRAPVDRARR